MEDRHLEHPDITRTLRIGGPKRPTKPLMSAAGYDTLIEDASVQAAFYRSMDEIMARLRALKSNGY